MIIKAQRFKEKIKSNNLIIIEDIEIIYTHLIDLIGSPINIKQLT